MEKADILELTVRYLHGLKRKDRLYVTGNSAYSDRFKAGFKHCAIEVSQFLNNIDQNANAHLMRHLSECIQRVDFLSTPPPVPTQNLNRIASPNESHVQKFYAKDYSVNVSNNNNYSSNNNNDMNLLKSASVLVNMNNNNNYLQQQSNHMALSQERVMYSSRNNNNNISDDRSVVEINNANKSPKEEPHSDVWRPW